MHGSKQVARGPRVPRGTVPTTPRRSNWKNLRHPMNQRDGLPRCFRIHHRSRHRPLSPSSPNINRPSDVQTSRCSTLILPMRKLSLIDCSTVISRTMSRRKCRPYRPPSLHPAPVDLPPSTTCTNRPSPATRACPPTASLAFYIRRAPRPAVRPQAPSPSCNRPSQQTTTGVYSASTPFLRPPTPRRSRSLSKPPVAPGLPATLVNPVAPAAKPNQPPLRPPPCRTILAPRPSSLLPNPVKPASL